MSVEAVATEVVPAEKHRSYPIINNPFGITALELTPDKQLIVRLDPASEETAAVQDAFGKLLGVSRISESEITGQSENGVALRKGPLVLPTAFIGDKAVPLALKILSESRPSSIEETLGRLNPFELIKANGKNGKKAPLPLILPKRMLMVHWQHLELNKSMNW